MHTRLTPLPTGILRWIPGLAALLAYQRRWLAHDVAAGLVLTAVLVPTGMAYAAAAGLPVISGLYATIAPLVAYAVVGPSRILVLGPDSVLAGLIAATILPLAAGDPHRAVDLAGTLALLAGALCVLAGLCRVGFLTDLLSKPIRYGYLNGIVLTVLIAQLPKLLGFPVSGANTLEEIAGLAQGIAQSRVNGVALAVGVLCLAVIFGFRRWAPAIPGVLIAVVGTTAVSAGLGLAARHGVVVAGPLPQGLPLPRLGLVRGSDLLALLPGAMAIALVSFADMSVLSRAFAQRHGAPS